MIKNVFIEIIFISLIIEIFKKLKNPLNPFDERDMTRSKTTKTIVPPDSVFCYGASQLFLPFYIIHLTYSE